MKKFKVRVEHKYYHYFTVYEIEAIDYHDAEKLAKEKFKEFGSDDIRNFEAFVFDKYKYEK